MVRNLLSHRTLFISFLTFTKQILADCVPKTVGQRQPTTNTSSAYDFLKNQQTILSNGCFKPENCTPVSKTLVIVPYRNREVHLNLFLINIHPFLQRQQVEYCIVVSEQVNKGKFNKGILMNAAFEEAKLFLDFDCVVFHDVDMLPENDENIYACKTVSHLEKQPIHLSTKINKYHYK